MADNVIAAIPRTSYGKGTARQLRRQGRIPGVFYYGHEINFAFAVDVAELSKILRERFALITIMMEGDEARECVIRELQRDPVDDRLLHIDLLGIKRGQKLTVTVSVKMSGTPLGVKTGGGILQQGVTELEVECLPKDIPREIIVDVSELEIGDSVYVSELLYPELKFLSDTKTLLATVLMPTLIREDEEEEELEGEEEEHEGEKSDDEE
ncbi:MAG: 50S ribosomal protein L25 [Candidatus Electryoneaceae bacterium]|nr:50S ribosomal protein L25 [Candidatus Electryoneaceae bacterium]